MRCHINGAQMAHKIFCCFVRISYEVILTFTAFSRLPLGSLDYLLGLSNNPSVKPDIQNACNITGLSKKSIDKLNTEGKHFYRLTGNKLKEFLHSENFGLQNPNKIRVLYLWTEKGALLHAKSLNTDKAWEVYDFL